jgi:hypothetical protein
LPENLREEFDNAINAPQQSAGNLKAAIQKIDDWTTQNMDAMKSDSQKEEQNKPEAGAFQVVRDASGRIVGIK